MSLDEKVALAEAVRRAALGVPGVVGVSPGVGYVEATYGRDVEVLGIGISSEGDRVTANVHVVVADTPIPPVERRLRAAVRHTIEELTAMPVGPINLYVDDIEMNRTVR